MRDVIWIQLDSIRYDHTSVPSSSYKRSTTPKLKQLAAGDRAYDFSRCYFHGIWTPASTASILTGLPPSRHGVGMYQQSLPQEVDTYPELLSETGYTTTGISTNVQISDLTDMNRGFDNFHYLIKENLLNSSTIRELLEFICLAEEESAGYTWDTKKHNASYFVNELAKRQISKASSSSSPLFLFVHHNVTHHAYYPPEYFQSSFGEPELGIDQALELVLDMSYNINKYIANGCAFSDKEWSALKMMYDATLRYADQKIAELVDYSQNHLDDPLIVVTADHGEFFGEDGLLDHKISTNTAVSHVPLIVQGVNLDRDIEDQIVQHSDIMQTVLQQAGTEINVPIGYDLNQQVRSYAVTQRGSERCDNQISDINRHNAKFDSDSFPDADVHSVQTEDYRYAYSEDFSRLFEIGGEDRIVDSVKGEIVDELEQFISEWLNKWGQPILSDGEKEIDEKTQKRLRDLGYMTE
ncbi:sulfatase-like hydrolase/transferase [Halobacterium salinarum]|uniref:sulfatase-like hydrolase/transferase n=1 Tax=Halobacterium salinarum TaxID=2242 RepID=UPI0025522671|nr:sulfatase-like hydrolase/transferase [Halobacterium salinarum]MDL0118805.1 sulfatase-like hydrolase/transferase [Halobacterium salinarum]